MQLLLLSLLVTNDTLLAGLVTALLCLQCATVQW
jgi:hypothetical protein